MPIMPDSLSDRLKALGLVPATALEKKPAQPPVVDFARQVHAQEIINSLGKAYVTEKTYPHNYQHGIINFDQISQFTSLSRAAKVQKEIEADVSRLLFLDTETTGLSGGTGTFAFLVGLGYFTPDGFTLKQYVLQQPVDEAAMLLEIINLSEQFSGIVTYNGKGFDIPLLRSRLILNRLPNPFESMAHFDLLYLSRRIWKNRLPSRALQDLEHEILQIPRTEEEVPGWMIPQIYFDYLRSGNANPLNGVIYHNGMDILSLAALFLYLSSSLENIEEVDRFNIIDYFSLGQIYFDIGLTEIAEKIYLQCETSDALPDPLKLISYQKLAALYKSRQNYECALLYWQKAFHFEDISSMVEMAKYYEHISIEYRAALYWTDTAITFLSKRGYDNYQNKKLGKELLKRKERLLLKIERKYKNV
jgi:uncharacterized protein YprB with RNaseH-like and TPR domain